MFGDPLLCKFNLVFMTLVAASLVMLAMEADEDLNVGWAIALVPVCLAACVGPVLLFYCAVRVVEMY